VFDAAEPLDAALPPSIDWKLVKSRTPLPLGIVIVGIRRHKSNPGKPGHGTRSRLID
jgi:hypothetical protein